MNDFTELATQIKKQAESYGQGSSFAVLDFDNTCIRNDIAEAVLAFVCKNGLLKSNSLLAAEQNIQKYHEKVFVEYHNLLNRGATKEAYLLCAKIFAGFTPEEARDVIVATIEDEGSATDSTELYGIPISRGLGVRPIMRELILSLEENNITIWIVSASPAIAVQTAAEHFGIQGKIIGLQNRIQEGVYTEEVLEPYSIQEGKVECIKAFIDPIVRPLLGVGDSMNDLPMLEYANIRAVINQQNALTNHAHKNNWLVL